MRETGLLLAQLTDLHVGGKGLNALDADKNLRWAMSELGALDPAPDCALLTADLVCGGAREELEQCAELLRDFPVPWYALPANHDLWGEDDASAWEALIGPRRQSVDLAGLRVILLDDVQRKPEGGWWAHPEDAALAWLEEQLSTTDLPCLVAHHVPILPVGDDYHDQWAGSNASEVLALLTQRNVVATVTGHWHRNGEWDADGVRVINTGALAGWNWTGTPPHYCFPVRPGYRLLHYDGAQLRSFWREGSYWTGPAPDRQVTLEWIGPAHTGGPRPQVHPAEVSARVTLKANAYAPNDEIASVEWSVTHKEWAPMTRVFSGVWSEWEAELDPAALRPAGELICCVRARTADGKEAFDEVPVRFGQRDSSAMNTLPAYPLAETLFELFYCPE